MVTSNEKNLKIGVLSGAAKNAGDFLIVRRARQLLRCLVPGCELVEFSRNRDLTPCLDEVNGCDCVVFAGGPGYVPDMYPGRFPLVEDLDAIKPPMLALGMGSWSPTGRANGVRFTDRSRRLLDRMSADGFGLGCRDRLTERVLRVNGYDDAVFTGCVAWYDLERVAMLGLAARPKIGEIRCIAISDPATSRNLDAPKHLIRELKRHFEGCEIKLVFHRGWTADGESSVALAQKQLKLAEWARSEGVEPIDISYSADGFSVYDDCDIHVGYRVHAHLYNVSRRKPSYLIEEDGRGFGAVEALGSEEHVWLARPSKAVRGLIAAADKVGLSADILARSQREAARTMVRNVLKDVGGGIRSANLRANERTIHILSWRRTLRRSMGLRGVATPTLLRQISPQVF